MDQKYNVYRFGDPSPCESCKDVYVHAEKRQFPCLKKKFNLILNIGSKGTKISKNCEKTLQKILPDLAGFKLILLTIYQKIEKKV